MNVTNWRISRRYIQSPTAIKTEWGNMSRRCRIALGRAGPGWAAAARRGRGHRVRA